MSIAAPRKWSGHRPVTSVMAEALERRALFAVSVIGSFNPGVGGLNAIGFDPASGNLFLHANGSGTIREFTTSGAEVGSAVPAPGSLGNDNESDIEFAGAPFTLGGTAVSLNTMLYFQGEESPDTARALDKDDGAVLAGRQLPPASANLVGGAFHPARGTLFVVDFGTDRIVEVSPADGTQVNSFPVGPAGSPAFDVFFGDVDVLSSTGNLYVVSDTQNVIRELTPAGAFVRDIDVGALGVSGLAGLAFDDARGEAWVGTTGGQVHRLGGVGAATPIVIGGFDAGRGGARSLRDGPANVELRADIAASFPGAVLSAAPALTAEYLATVGLLVIATPASSSSAITPLSAAEQAALLDYVRGGGGAVIITDNDDFAAAAEVANESLLDPFGLDAVGLFTGNVVVTNTSHPVTNGPFGGAAALDTNRPGSFDNLGAATELARLAPGRSAVAVLDRGAIAPGSGAVVFFSDTGLIEPANGDNAVLIRNAIAFAAGQAGSPPPPPAGTVETVNTVNIPGPTPQLTDLVVLGDGRIIAVGTARNADDDIALFRLNADGTLDTTFGNGGVVFRDLFGDESASAVVVQADGRIAVAGTVRPAGGDPATTGDFFVARFNADGSVDHSFGGGGFALADFVEGAVLPGSASADAANDLALTSDGRLVVVGTTDALDADGDLALAGFTPDGNFDLTFGNRGRVITPGTLAETANAVAVQSDGRTVIAGESADPGGLTGAVLLARYNADGSLDASFGAGGVVTRDVRDGIDGATSLAIQPDGRIVFGGFAGSGDPASDAFDADFAVGRLTAGGSADATFDGDGVAVTDIPGRLAQISQVAIDPGGNVVAAGRGAASPADIAAGRLDTVVARYRPDGSLDARFSDDGILVIPFDDLTTAAPASLTTRAAAAILNAALTAGGADLIEQQALIALTVQGRLRILQTAGAEVRLAEVTGDAGAPSATIALLPSVTDAGQTAATFVVEYADDLAIDVSTLGTGDILVSGPGVSNQPAELVGVDVNTNGATRRATYRFVPPGGSFTPAANGTYQLSVGAGEVKDATGTPLAAGDIAGATFTVNVSSEGPNLAAGQVTGKLPAAVVGGAKASGASVLVTNTGNQPAAGTVRVRVVASADGTFDDGDAPVGDFRQKLNLKAGQAKALKLSFKTFPTGLPDGDYFLLARIDADNAVPETADTFDNVGSTAAAINIAAPFVDLGFAGPVTGFKSPLAPGTKGKVSAPLRNAGNVPAKATVGGRLFASTDGTQSGDDRLVGMQSIKVNLKSGATKAAKLSFVAPLDLPAGSYTLILVLDAPGNDRDPADNTAVSVGAITIG